MNSYYHSDSSDLESVQNKTPTEFVTASFLLLYDHQFPFLLLTKRLTYYSRPSLPGRLPNENRSVSDPVNKLAGLPTKVTIKATPGSSRMENVQAPARNSSIDSAISAISTGSTPSKNPQDISNSPADVAKLIKAAGTPEAVIQYLLKEKQSQSQQNAQLWRLVDKQRAMILGLNKDLERSLKEKEKYRKKLKELMASQTIPAMNSPTVPLSSQEGSESPAPKVEVEPAYRPSLEIPASPSVGSDKPSPIDVTMAPYPITPPADQLSNGPPSAVGDILDPIHAMPEASEHALHQYDQEAEEREADSAKRLMDTTDDLPLNTPIPAAFALRSPVPPPQCSPPAPPSTFAPLADGDDGDDGDDGFSNFPSPPQLAPRKPPPAPLQLKDSKLSPTMYEGPQSASEHGSPLEAEGSAAEKRGRRRTRQEDDELREVLVLQEAEARSLSKKSKQSSNSGTTPKDITIPSMRFPEGSPTPSPAALDNPTGASSPLPSLAGVLNGDSSDTNMPLLSPGLPASPRPVPVGSGPNSPPLSPRQAALSSASLSPRPPPQQIPFPPSTPLQTPSPPHENIVLKSPQPLHIVKKTVEPEAVSTPTSSHESPTERTRVFKGFMTDEYPDLLIPPNALPSVGVKVASSRMKPSRASLISVTQLEEDPVFTLAILSRSDNGELWRVEKDSMSLAKLDSRLKQCLEFTAKTPDRSLFSGHAPAKLDARRIALDLYFDELLNTPIDTATAVELCRYLSTNVLPPNADEMGSSTGPDDEGAAKIGPGGRQFKSGYLTKRGKNFGGWKARFFVVEGPQLKYYETPGGAHLGTIKLQGAQIGRQSHQNDVSSPAGINDDMDNQYRHAFLILEPKKKDPTAMTKHVLCAENDQDRDRWVNVLLPWTSYKDPADEESKRDNPQDRQTSASGNAKVAKRKGPAQGRPQPPQPKETEDKLIGVSYDTMKQGDKPSTDNVELSPATTMTSQAPYTISAPRDPQLIADSSLWANKMNGYPQSGMDEKKAKKRSFFGFGPKQRSSSDGGDSLFGDGMPQQYNGPVRRVFGAPLGEAVRYNSPRDVRVPLPAVVYRCIQYLDARGAVTEEGIFRLSGSNVVIKQLKERFDNEGDINLIEDSQYHDIHAVASMLKAYLRELPTSILTRDLHLEFVAVTEMNSQAEKIVALSELVTRLPQGNATLLKYLIAFLIKIINHADQNKMTVRNVGIVFSPTLTIPAPVFALFLQNYQAIFGIAPEQYELPSPTSMDERHERDAAEFPPRPATSSGGVRESPHRHRLAEALAEQRRGNTPPPGASTHPLAGFSQVMRSTPTPPPGQRYEPNYYAQQNGNTNVSLRPPYDGMAVPPNFDSTQNYMAQQRMGYGQAPVYDLPANPRASRRESSMFMGPPRGLTPQGSMSRLREF